MFMGLVAMYMRFNTFDDFYTRKDIIKKYFSKLSLDEKYIYKMYVYSNRLIKEDKLNKIWEFLNEPFGSFYYVSGDMLSIYL